MQIESNLGIEYKFKIMGVLLQWLTIKYATVIFDYLKPY